MKKFIEVRFQFEGLHCWPEAPPEVEFLRVPHRHTFHVRARMDVSHDDRELEFIMVKRELSSFVGHWGYNLGRTSCETMAESILSYIVKYYGRAHVEVEVNEDGENGAIVSVGI